MPEGSIKVKHMERLKINVGPTFITVPSDLYGNVVGGVNIRHIAGKLVDFEFIPGQRPVPRQKFTLFDRKFEYRTMPRHVLPILTDFLNKENVPYTLLPTETVTPREVVIPISPQVEARDYQAKAVEFLTAQEHSMRLLGFATGMGKTVVAILASAALSYCTIVIVSGLVEQWQESFRKYTLLPDEDIYVIKGSQSLMRLFADPDYKPSVIISSTETIQPYIIGKHDPMWPSWDLFCNHYGIGTKIMDEAHLMFLANTMIDLKTSIVNNIYLTATPGRSSNNEKRIYSIIYPDEIQLTLGHAKKYIDTYFYGYKFDVGVKERRLLTRRGYSHVKYEKALLKKQLRFEQWMDEIVLPKVFEHYINIRVPKLKHKLMFFVSTIEFADAVVGYLKKKFPKFDISTYLGRDPESVLETADIIVTTHKSAGTGTDIAGLLVEFNTVSFQTDIQALQQIGRLREPKCGTTPRMIDIANTTVATHLRHAKNRKAAYRQVSRKLHEYNL